MKSLILISLIAFLGCTRNPKSQTSSVENNPDAVVTTFVELSVASKTAEDKKKLLNSCGGDLKRAFERMTDDEFKLVYLSGQLKVEKMEILKTQIQNDTASVHYRVSIENKQGTEVTQETNEREAQLRKNTSGWVIEAIRMKGTDKLAFTRGMMF